MRLFWPAVFVFSVVVLCSSQEHLANSQPAAIQNPPAATHNASKRPKVFITDSQSWETSGSAGGSGGNWGAQTHGGARPQTAEIIKTFGERCRDVIVNNKLSVADYIVVLDHEGGKGLLRHKNKVAVFEKLSGDVVMSHSTLSLGGSVQECLRGHHQRLGAAQYRDSGWSSEGSQRTLGAESNTATYIHRCIGFT